MMRLRSAPITQLDLTEYLREKSDFSFEMVVLKHLKARGFTCDHAGTYSDPVTGRTKKFGIRARKSWGRFSVALAVECLHPRANFPLLVQTVPRVKAEAFHQLIIGRDVKVPAKRDDLLVREPYPAANSRTLIVKSPTTPYITDGPVGKALEFVGRERTGGVTSSDAANERVAQVINSTHDLIVRAHHDTAGERVCAVLPLLVVSDGRVWQVDYDEDGNMQGGASQTGHVPYFVGRRFRTTGAGPSPGDVSFTVSHVDIITLNNFERLLSRYLDEDEYPPGILPFGEKLD